MAKLKSRKTAPLHYETPTERRTHYGALEFDPRYDPRVNEQEKLKSLTTTVEKRPAPEVPSIYLPDYEGQGFVSSMSDRTAAGGLLTDINGVPLNRPVNLQGGQGYMFDNPSQVWASAEQPSRAVMMQAAAAKALTGKDPLYLPWRMAPSGGDFATMTGETMLSFAESNMGKRAKKSLDKDIKTFIPDWKGIDSPESIEQFRSTPDSVRKSVKAMMDLKYRDEGGLGIGEARLSVSDPSQVGAPEGYIQNVGRIFADKPLIEQSGHASYPYGIPGEGIGRIADDRSIFELNPKVFPAEKDIRAILANPETARTGYEALPDVVTSRSIPDPREPRQSDTRALQMKPYYGIITEEMLRNMGYAEGGMVTDTQTPAVEAIKGMVQDPQVAEMLNLDLAKLATMHPPQKMANGGAVRMARGGSPLKSLDEPTLDDMMLEMQNAPDQSGVSLNQSPNVDPRFSVDRKPSEYSYTGYTAALPESPSNVKPAPTGYDIRVKEAEKQLEFGKKPDWMSTQDFIKDQAARKGYSEKPSSLSDVGSDILTALGESKMIGGAFRAMSAPYELAEKVIGSSMGVDPMTGMIGKTGELHNIPKAGRLATQKYGVPLAEKGLSMWEQGKGDPLSILGSRTTGMQGNPAVSEIFAGSKSKTADLAMRDLAEARLNAGDDPALVWKETGWGRPPWGGDMRYEIPDVNLDVSKAQSVITGKTEKHIDKVSDLGAAYHIRQRMENEGKTLNDVIADWQLKKSPSNKAIELAEDSNLSTKSLESKFNSMYKKPTSTYAKTSGELGEFVNHPELFAAYPDFADAINFKTIGTKDTSKALGMFNPKNDELSIKASHALGDGLKSTTAHELSHAVQSREGFPMGGNTEAIVKYPELFDPTARRALSDLQNAIANDPLISHLKNKVKNGGVLTEAENDAILLRSQSLPEHNAFLNARKDFLSSGTPQELYARLQGEAEARLTQHRLDYPAEKRREIYPYDPVHYKKATGYNIDEIIQNPSLGKKISSASMESAPKKKIPEGEELIAHHNLSPEKLFGADKLGGMPVPSLAISKASDPLTNFGEITLIAPSEFAQPSSKNPIYRSDAYTATKPSVQFANDLDAMRHELSKDK